MQFVEVVIAPAFSKEAMEIFARKQNVRVIKIPLAKNANRYDMKRVGGACWCKRQIILMLHN